MSLRQLASAVPEAFDAAAARLVKTLDLSAVRRNLDRIRTAAAGREVVPVLKGNAYGFGARHVADALASDAINTIAVDTIGEALDLRETGWAGGIQVLDPDVEENYRHAVPARLTPCVAQPAHVRAYAAAAAKAGAPIRVWVRTNVGFNRFGDRSDFRPVIEALVESGRAVIPVGLLAHLSSAESDEIETASQAAEFRARLAGFKGAFGAQVGASLCASYGLLHESALALTTQVRPGIALYNPLVGRARELDGWSASPLAALEQAWTVRGRVLDVILIRDADGLGYDRSIKDAVGRTLATVASGFSRGITPTTARPITGLLHGIRCLSRGMAGMDALQFDVTNLPQAAAGDWVILVGADAGSTLSPHELASSLSKSLYALVAGLHMPTRYYDTP